MSGIGRYIQNILKNNKYLEKIVMLGRKEDLELMYDNDIINYDSKIYGIDEQKKFPYKKMCKKSILHVPHYNIPILFRGTLVTTIHDITHVLFPEYLPNKFALYYAKFMIKLAIIKSKYILTVSENTKNDLIKYFNANPDKIVVTYNGVDDKFVCKSVKEYDYLYDKYNIEKNKKILLYVGNKKPHKNIATLIKALALLENKEEYKLILSGKGFDSYTELEELTTKLHLSENIIHTGHVTDEELVDLYNFADLFVFPSLYEGFGIPVLEAMACGTPVVSSNSSSLPEVVGDAGILVNPIDEVEIAKSIEFILKNNELYNEMVYKGKERAKVFTWDSCRRKTENIYERLMK